MLTDDQKFISVYEKFNRVGTIQEFEQFEDSVVAKRLVLDLQKLSTHKFKNLMLTVMVVENNNKVNLGTYKIDSVSNKRLKDDFVIFNKATLTK